MNRWFLLAAIAGDVLLGWPLRSVARKLGLL